MATKDPLNQVDGSKERRVEPARRTKRAPAREVVRRDDGTDRSNRTDPHSKRGKVEAMVACWIKDAIEARAASGIEQVWAEDEDLYLGEDEVSRAYSRWIKNPAQRVNPNAASGDQASRLHLNITQPKTDSAVARVQEMLVPTDEKPWDMEPTPIPDIQDVLEGDPMQMVQMADGSPMPAAAVAMKVMDDATLKAEAEKRWVEDEFIEGDVYKALRDVIRDAGRKGTGCLKGPVAVNRTKRRWSLDPDTKVTTLEVLEEVHPASTRIRIEDVFPAPDCGENIHKGSYFVERDYMTGRKLRELAMLPDYDQQALIDVLEEGPMRGTQLRSTIDNRRRSGVTSHEARTYEVFYVYGWINPGSLSEIGLNRELDENDPGRLTPKELKKPFLPAVVTMVNGRAVKAILNPMETGAFPYDLFPWKQREGQPWGRGVPREIRPAQLIVLAAVRRLMENAGLSAGPQIVLNPNCIKPAPGGVYEIRGRKLWMFTPTEAVQTPQQAFAIFEVASGQAELSAIIQFGLDMADRLTNLPLLLQGEQAAGRGPETLGFMQMLMKNSTSTLRVIAKEFDDLLIIPHLKRWHDWCQERGPDEAKGGDTQVKAKGATELVQREEDGEFLIMLWQMKDSSPELRIDPAKLAGALARGKRFNIATVQYSDDDWKKKQEQMANTPPPQDPRIEAARMRLEATQATEQARAQTAEADRQFKAQEGELDRRFKEKLSAVEKEIEMMRLSGSENISIAQIKAMLAGKAMDARLKSDEMSLKLNPENPSRMGI